MEPKFLSGAISVTSQINASDALSIKQQGFGTIMCNRPDGEAQGQPSADEIADAANELGLKFVYIPIIPGNFEDQKITAFVSALEASEKPVLAYCRTGTRSATLWALSEAGKMPSNQIITSAANAGYDIRKLGGQLGKDKFMSSNTQHFDVVIVGGGSGGIAAAASLLKRRQSLTIAIVEPNEKHYYQPGWTMVGAGVFDAPTTERPTSSVIPRTAKWIKTSAKSFQPEDNQVTLEDGMKLQYDILVVAPGIHLDWGQIDGLEETLGKNGVTSNYRYDLAPYTHELVKNLKGGTALFTQPPMPIKCAGAPQKAMYLSCDNWRESGDLPEIDVEFHNAGGALFGIDAYVPALMEYVDWYGIGLKFGSNLVAVDGPNKKAIFETKAGQVEKSFDMLHVCPPQVAPKFIAESPLAAESGYVDVDQATLQHTKFPNIFGLGDGTTTPNAKTMAAARKQAPVVAVNALAVLDGENPEFAYDGYGSCPLTVEKGKIVLAEFGYGGKLLPSFPNWLIDGTRPARLSWLLKSEALPWIYWNGMLKGHEWLAKPDQKTGA